MRTVRTHDGCVRGYEVSEPRVRDRLAPSCASCAAAGSPVGFLDGRAIMAGGADEPQDLSAGGGDVGIGCCGGTRTNGWAAGAGEPSAHVGIRRIQSAQPTEQPGRALVAIDGTYARTDVRPACGAGAGGGCGACGACGAGLFEIEEGHPPSPPGQWQGEQDTPLRRSGASQRRAGDIRHRVASPTADVPVSPAEPPGSRSQLAAVARRGRRSVWPSRPCSLGPLIPPTGCGSVAPHASSTKAQFHGSRPRTRRPVPAASR